MSLQNEHLLKINLDALQWMGAVRIADKNLTIIHK